MGEPFLFEGFEEEKKPSSKDWSGNSYSGLAMVGARNHAVEHRVENDYYATDPKAVEMLLELEQFSPDVWEPAVGGGHIAGVLKDHGYKVKCSDLVDRGYEGTEVQDFLETDVRWGGDIVTNPPYILAEEFIRKSLDSVWDGRKVAMFLKLQFLEGKQRKEFFLENPPMRIYVSSSRIGCARNGVSFSPKDTGNAVCYAWFIWSKGYKGAPEIRWFN